MDRREFSRAGLGLFSVLSGCATNQPGGSKPFKLHYTREGVDFYGQSILDFAEKNLPPSLYGTTDAILMVPGDFDPSSGGVFRKEAAELLKRLGIDGVSAINFYRKASEKWTVSAFVLPGHEGRAIGGVFYPESYVSLAGKTLFRSYIHVAGDYPIVDVNTPVFSQRAHTLFHELSHIQREQWLSRHNEDRHEVEAEIGAKDLYKRAIRSGLPLDPNWPNIMRNAYLIASLMNLSLDREGHDAIPFVEQAHSLEETRNILDGIVSARRVIMVDVARRWFQGTPSYRGRPAVAHAGGVLAYFDQMQKRAPDQLFGIGSQRTGHERATLRLVADEYIRSGRVFDEREKSYARAADELFQAMQERGIGRLSREDFDNLGTQDGDVLHVMAMYRWDRHPIAQNYSSQVVTTSGRLLADGHFDRNPIEKLFVTEALTAIQRHIPSLMQRSAERPRPAASVTASPPTAL